MPKSAVFAIAARDFPNVFDARFRENRLLGHAPRLISTPASNVARLQPRCDIYKLFNANGIQDMNTRYGATWLKPGSILLGRLYKFGVQVDF
jgi:hypothetical protein